MSTHRTTKLKHKLTRAALTLLMMLAMSVTASATDFITDVMVIGNNNQTEFNNLKASLVSAGWTDIDYDLNKGCGSSSDYIHLLYKTQNSTGNTGVPITEFYIMTGSDPTENLEYEGRIYNLVPYQGSTSFVNSYGNLNNNTNGVPTYLYYTKDELLDNTGVTGITFNTTQNGAVGQNGGYTGFDLNSGCGSGTAYIYMHLTTATGANVVTLSSGSGNVQLRNGHILTGTGGTETRVTIADGSTVTLNGVNITAIPNDNSHAWPGIRCWGDVILVLAENTTNSVKGGRQSPGINLPVNYTLIIRGSGALNATGMDNSAGIGSSASLACGNITIISGTVTANGGYDGAGIGSGYGSSWQTTCGDITIYGGTVTANGGRNSAGIGSGYCRSYCGNITISGGTVTATGGETAAGIGTGDWASHCGNITITNNVTRVTATKGSTGNTAIGVGETSSSSTCGTITIGDVQTGPITMSPFVTYPYTVAFDANGGTGSMANMHFMYNVARNLNNNSFTRTGYLFQGWAITANGGVTYTNGQSVSNLTSTYNSTVTLYAKWAFDPAHLSVNGNEYTIHTSTGWDLFCDLLADGSYENFTGKTVKLDHDITITTMAGVWNGSSSNRMFSGTFNGQGHTLTLAYSSTEDHCAPFRYINNATFQNLRIAGTINTSNQFAGVVGHAYGTNSFTNCRSSITINSTRNGDGTHGGFVGVIGQGTTTFTGCVFDGTFSSTVTTNWGGFVGFVEGNAAAHATFHSCLFAPANSTFGFDTNGSQTFARLRNNNSSYVTFSSSNINYYTKVLGGAQAKPAYTITGDQSVTVAFSGSVTNYNVSDIHAYNTGMVYNNTLYASNGTSVSLNLGSTPPTGYVCGGYQASAGTITGSANPYTLAMPAQNVSITGIWTPDPTHLSVDGNVYTIHTATGWDVFCDLLAENSNGYFTDKTVILADDISVTRMAGDSSHAFSGTFDGQGHTLTVSYNVNMEDTAPFHYVNGATITNLVTAGTITTSIKYASGMIGRILGGAVSITNCVSGVTINSSINGDGTHGGFVGVAQYGTLTITGSMFSGEMLGASTTLCGGFVGWTESNNNVTTTITNCLFAPTTLQITNGHTFSRARNLNSVTVTNSYYTEPLGTPQGLKAYSITGETYVTIAFSGQATNYNVSAITAYSTGMAYNSTLYAGNGEMVSLNLGCNPGYLSSGFAASAGTLTGTTNPYTLTMPAEDVNITATWTPDSTHFEQTDTAIYTIHTATGWDVFCDLLAENSNGYFTGKYVVLGDDISVTRMAGSSGHEFSGTFEGWDHTLTVNYQNTDGTVRTTPFSYVNGATIMNLIVAGSITGTAPRAAGIVGETVSNLSHVTNCLSSVSVSGGSYTGGISIGGNVEITGCRFNGTIVGTDKSGGFVGYSNSALVIHDCLFAPQEGSSISGGTFYYNGGGEITPVNSYYTMPLGTPQGKQAHRITSDADYAVTVDFNGDATEYDVSGINAYSMGMAYNDDLYAGNGDAVSLNLGCTPPSGYFCSGYQASAGTLTGTANPYTLTMPNEDVNIGAIVEMITAVDYIDGDGVMHTCSNYTMLTGGETTLNAGWYVVPDDITYDSTLTLNGDVTLILCNDKTMTISTNKGEGISGDTLTIYGQSLGSIAGTLNITTNLNWTTSVSVSTYTQHSGNVVVVNDNSWWFANGLSAGKITINGGSIHANANGTGDYGIYGSLIINGGKVEASSIFANGNITLGWTNTDDYILAGSYSGTVSVKTGQAFYYEDGGEHVVVRDTLDSSQIQAIAGKTLRPHGVNYVDGDGERHICTDYTVLTGDETTLNAGWYAVDHDITYDSTLTLNDDVTLILCNGKTMSVATNSDSGILGSHLTIYGQSLDSITAGTLNVTYNESQSTINLDTYIQHSGNVVVSNSSDKALYAIHITMNGGSINANGSEYGAYATETVTINGGSIYANGYVGGIYTFGTITVNGGSIHANGHNDGMRSDNLSINGGKVEASSIYSVYDISLGWTNTDDYIHANYYVNNYGAVFVKSGQSFYYEYGGEHVIVSDTLDFEQISAIMGKTLRPRFVNYMDGEGEMHICTDYTMLTGNETTLDAGWYAVDSDITYHSNLTIGGDVNLILCNGKTMTLGTDEIGNGGIKSSENNDGGNLIVYGQCLIPEVAGTLNADVNRFPQFESGFNYREATPTGEWNAIRVSNYTQHSGNVVTSNPNWHALEASNITINGGSVYANGFANGILAYSLTISGGSIYANGGEENGIRANGSMTINGGSINANGGEENGIMVNGGMTINGGSINAYGGSVGTYGIWVNNDLTINGGKLDANSIWTTSGILTLGWTDIDDYIYVGSYNVAGMTVKRGQAFYYDNNVIVSGTLNQSQIRAIWGKTLRPYPLATYTLTPEAYTLTNSGYTDITCTLSSLELLEVVNGSSLVPATVLEFYMHGGTLTDSNGNSIPFLVDDMSQIRAGTSVHQGPFSSPGETFVVAVYIDSAYYAAAAPGIYTGTLVYDGYWNVGAEKSHLDGVRNALVPGASGSIALTLVIPEPSTVVQSINLASGVNWVSFNVEITLDSLKAALESAMPVSGITIAAKDDGQTFYNGTRWRGALASLDMAQMYRITVPAACEIVLEGMPVDPASHPITIKSGLNWIGYPFMENMTITDAFAGFAVSGDEVRAKDDGIAKYVGTRWRGALTHLVPGQGYIYNSAVSGNRTFTFPTDAK